MRVLNEQETARLGELTKGTYEIKSGYEGLTLEEAVELVMMIEGVSEQDARIRVASARGESIDDVIEV